MGSLRGLCGLNQTTKSARSIMSRDRAFVLDAAVSSLRISDHTFRFSVVSTPMAVDAASSSESFAASARIASMLRWISRLVMMILPFGIIVSRSSTLVRGTGRQCESIWRRSKSGRAQGRAWYPARREELLELGHAQRRTSPHVGLESLHLERANEFK